MSYNPNYQNQNQKGLYIVYGPSPNTIPNPNAVPKQITNPNLIPSGYNSGQTNSMNTSHAQRTNLSYNANIRTNAISSPMNAIYNQSQMINTNLTYLNKQIPLQNNNSLNMINNSSQLTSGSLRIPKRSPTFDENRASSLLDDTQRNPNQIIKSFSSSINIKDNIINKKINQTQRNINEIAENPKKMAKDEIINKSRKGKEMLQVEAIVKTVNSICKIIINQNNETYYGTGFFMKFSGSLKFLITCCHVIPPELKNQRIKLEIWENKKLELDLCGRYIKFLEKPKDITAIEIKDSDEINKYIQFLNYDFNYCQSGYGIYNKSRVFSIEYPLGKNAYTANGEITRVDDFEFEHNIDTNQGASGCPIILINDNINLCLVIGIHKGSVNEDIKEGTFIGEIIKEINEGFLQSIHNDNYIIGELYINNEDINKNIRIINSYEETKRLYNDDQTQEKFKNEKEIKDCEIKINDKSIPFCYCYKFVKEGKYLVKYKFKKYLSHTNHMFNGCDSLTKIYLNNFNTKNVNNMSYMFSGCKSLTYINLSNSNTQNVTDMSGMFFGCKSLTNLNISDFNTKNVDNMSKMFCGCYSLTCLELSNFNTQKVTDMNEMFFGCSSLTELNLSNFNTKCVTNMNKMFWGCQSLIKILLTGFNTTNVTSMKGMFFGCNSLIALNLSNFDTQNVTDMTEMFWGCKSLTALNLYNFITKNVTKIQRMFTGCTSLTIENLVTKDEKIRAQLTNSN